jgi:hypothetical protein
LSFCYRVLSLSCCVCCCVVVGLELVLSFLSVCCCVMVAVLLCLSLCCGSLVVIGVLSFCYRCVVVVFWLLYLSLCCGSLVIGVLSLCSGCHVVIFVVVLWYSNLVVLSFCYRSVVLVLWLLCCDSLVMLSF